MEFPEPVLSIAIEPKTKADMDRLGESLERLAQEDPSFRVSTDPETGQTLISGMGELHLEIITDRLAARVQASTRNVGPPQVAYKETITKPVRVEGRYIKQTGGTGDYGVVVLEVEPGSARLRASRSRTPSRAASVPREYVRAPCARAARRPRRAARSAGYPVVDVKVRLVDGQAHDVDSSERSFKIAGSIAMQRGAAHGAARAARADHEGRGGHAERVRRARCRAT